MQDLLDFIESGKRISIVAVFYLELAEQTVALCRQRRSLWGNPMRRLVTIVSPRQPRADAQGNAVHRDDTYV